MPVFEEIPGSADKPFSAEQFLSYVRRAELLWSGKPNAVEAAKWRAGRGDKWVYRGHWDARWPLLPSAWRPIVPEFATSRKNALAPLIERFSNLPLDLAPIHKPGHPSLAEAAAWESSMIEAVLEFHLLARELGFPQINRKLMRPSEYDCLLVQGTKYRYNPSATWDTTEPWPFGSIDLDSGAVALAQHHGIPTHYLDWSESPVVACHFAASPPKEFLGEVDIAVWALRETNLEEGVTIAKALNGPCYQFIFPPTDWNSYLRSQRGLLLDYSIYGFSFFKAHGRWPSLRDILAPLDMEKPILRKMILRKEQVPELRALLDVERITQAHLMPTLDNVASTIISRW